MLRRLAYIGFAAVILVILVEMRVYGWNESLFIYSFPFNQMQPLRIHYITMIVCIISMTLSLIAYGSVGFWKSFTLSSLVALMGLSSFELIWHIGRGFGYGVDPGFWLFYLLLVFFCFTYLQRRWLKYLSFGDNLLYALGQFGFLIFWLYYAKVFDFYPSLLLYDAYLGPNPHGIGFFVFKSTVLLSPLMLIKGAS